MLASLERAPNLVLSAEPGAGKTTRVPPAILDAGLAGGEIVVLEPRRLAARMAARRVAAEREERPGQTVGFQVRFDRVVSADTRIRFVTEGVLARQMTRQPTLPGVSVIIADEIHERHLAGDVVLARARALQREARPDLRIIAMSATLEAASIAGFLGDCPVVKSEGRAHPVTVEFQPHPSELPLDKQVSAAVRRLARDGVDGDVLVFLPGAREIRRAQEACADVARAADLDVVPLHGDLPAAEQDRAVARGPRRKLILSTNVAESSITIPGVVAVVDSGLARVARTSPWTGLPGLATEPISQASAAQRAGRAGRLRPGRCLRLYTEHDHDGRRRHDDPEIARADLAEAVLELRAIDRRPDQLSWIDPPPAVSVTAAEALLARLGAVDDDGAITDVGRRMLRFPLHPRLARVVVHAEDLGVADDGCAIAALAGEREIRSQRRGIGGGPQQADASGPADLLEDLALLDAGDRGLDRRTASAVRRARKQLARIARARAPRPDGDAGVDAALQQCLLVGFADRVARRRRPGGRELSFAGGGGGALSPASVVLDAELMVCVRASERGGGRAEVVVHSACAIEADWLLDLYIDRIAERDGLVWNPDRERVEGASRLEYDGLVLDDSRDPAAARRDPEAAGEVLADAVRRAGPGRFIDAAALAQWRRRVALAREHAPDLAIPAVDDAFVIAGLVAACPGRVSFAELREVPRGEILRGALAADQRRAVDRLAPETVSIPGRRRVPVTYEDDRPPWIQSRLQDFFGMERGPAVAGGAVPLVLHLLAPNRRAVQVTTDLASFWANHYPKLRKQLSRRYPRHKWPSDPREA